MAIAQQPSSIYTYLENLRGIFTTYGDQINASLVNDLIVKLEDQEVTIACCGYVSAGKSRLLNLLIGQENLLPVSPLPSSMNTVYLKPGNKLQLMGKNKQPSPPTFSSVEQLADLCRDPGIISLELTCATPGGMSFIDTQGVDSIESGKCLAENQALLLADLVIYLTDYNHVQSQVNFNFLKLLEARKIPYVLVVNQIDKHVEQEISLTDFRNRLCRSLDQWGLNPTEICFTSLLVEANPFSQLEELKRVLTELKYASHNLQLSTVVRSVEHLLNRHRHFFSEQFSEHKEQYLWVSESGISEQEALSMQRELEQVLGTLRSLPSTIETATMTEIQKILDNAPLFAFETRELARQFLESRQPGFRAGIFASSVKTAKEQQRRLDALHTELKAKSEANLTWHVRKILSGLPVIYNLQLDNYSEEVSQWEVSLDPELLEKTMSPGALVTGEYVMNYTRDLASAIKSLYRQHCLFWIQRVQAAACSRVAAELPELEAKLAECATVLEAYAQLGSIDNRVKEHYNGLFYLWQQVAQEIPQPGFRKTQELPKMSDSPAQDKVVPMEFPRGTMGKSVKAATKVHPRLEEIACQLTACADLAAPLPGLNFWVESLRQRTARLENNLFTVALFGAFSAGKSSLANAMLGENVLPVSPNPTTAAINKILPPTSRYPHGTIKVKLKTLEDLTADMCASLAVLGLTAKTLETALEYVSGLNNLESELEAKPHYSFLQAVARGIAASRENLGQELTVSYAEFRAFVVEEEQACFVEWIELYFACPLTDLGVVLVDTPGSNSTNARHTNVSFDYVKNADAVLFVTYYNNPFCKADAQFLAQLGKVKDTFELDKMFFLVNAADLAQTNSELESVVKHVEESLRACEILRPRIFPVSSQLALLAKLAAAKQLEPGARQLYFQRLKLDCQGELPDPEQVLSFSGFKRFETGFYGFIEHDLIDLAVEAAQKEIDRLVQQVSLLVETTRIGDSARQAKLQHYQKLKTQILKNLAQCSFVSEQNAISQEIDELLYYVNKRFVQHYSGLFNSCFFMLAKPKDEQPKLAVQSCLKELVQEIEIELGQEFRATALRIEKYVTKSLQQVLSRQNALIMQTDQESNFFAMREFQVRTEFDTPGLVWDASGLNKVPGLYKNPSDWVQGQGRARMREGVLKLIEPQLHNWLKSCEQTLKQVWLAAFDQECKNLQVQITEEVSAYYSGLSAVLEQGYDLNYLEEALRLLQQRDACIAST